jgi:hypothetical protein
MSANNNEKTTAPEPRAASEPSDPAMAGRKPAAKREKPSANDSRELLVPAGQSAPRYSNMRRSSHALQLFTLLLVIMVLAFAACLSGLYSFYQRKIEPNLAKAPAVPLAVPVTLSGGDAQTAGIPPEYKDALNAATSKIGELQKQIDALRAENEKSQTRLAELSDRLAQKASEPSVPPTQATDNGTSALTNVATVVPAGTIANQELVLLKERNRLTGFADEAIAEGKREALNRLLEALKDKELSKLQHAAYAEIQRVYYHLRYMSRIEKGYTIPVNELFKDTAIRSETDLNTEQIISLLQDQEKGWKIRLRAAYLLGGRRTPEVGDALVKALKDDPVLDVAKESQFSFEQNTNRSFLLFDISSIEEWWAQQKNMNSEPLPKQKQDAK